MAILRIHHRPPRVHRARPTTTRRVARRQQVISAAIAAWICILLVILCVEIADGSVARWPRISIKIYTPAEKRPPTEKELDSTEKESRLLISKRNGMGVYNSINTERMGMDILNPTLLELPLGSQHNFLVVARAYHVDARINGTDYRRARQVASFANLTFNHPQQPEIITGNWSRLLIEDFLGPYHHCKHQPKMDKYIGPEDMKLFWTRRGAPLLVFTHQTPDENLCEGMFMVDVRAIVPELNKVLGYHADRLPPVLFNKPVALRRQPPEGHESDARYQREKNWAPVQSPLSHDDQELMFMVEPSHLFRWNTTGQPVEEIPTQNETAVEAPYPPNAAATWHSDEQTCLHDVMMSNKHVHQSTPMLSLTLCDRGRCEPDADNTVLLGMVQRRYDPPGVYSFTWYERRIVVYNAVPPYNMMSVSKILSYHGEMEDKYIWTGSMVYWANSTRIPYDRNHGYLDDEIWLSFGIADKSPGWIDVSAKELIKDHYFCQNASRGYRDSVAHNVR
jgi:hypothetical protein